MFMNQSNLINVQHAAAQLMQQIHDNLPNCDPDKVTSLVYLVSIALRNEGYTPDVNNFADATIAALTDSTDSVIANAEAIANLTILQNVS